MRGAIVAAVAVVLIARAVPAGAVARVSIFGPGSESFPIAVVPLKDQGGDADHALGGRFARVLSHDLDLSGYFRLVDPKTFIENDSAGLTAETTDFVGWGALGAQALVKGGISVSGDTVTVEARLFDVPGRQEVAGSGRRYSGRRAELPRMAHRMADAILEYLTGERGPFDSEIALVRGKGGPLKDIYRFTFDMDEPARVTDERSIVVNPRWRPDVRAILFTSYREHQPRLFQVEVATRQVTPIGPRRGAVLDGAWSPDGSRLLATIERGGNSDIFLIDRDGQVLRQLTDHWDVDVAPAWAPDGRRFVFCSSRAGSPQVYAMDVDGGNPVRISRTGSYNTSPAWSPKGDHIAYTTRSGGSFQIVVAAADGSGPQTIITSAGSNENPSWGADGRYLVFSSTRGGRRHIYFADRDGRTQKELTRGAWDDTSPSWSRRLD